MAKEPNGTGGKNPKTPKTNKKTKTRRNVQQNQAQYGTGRVERERQDKMETMGEDTAFKNY